MIKFQIYSKSYKFYFQEWLSATVNWCKILIVKFTNNIGTSVEHEFFFFQLDLGASKFWQQNFITNRHRHRDFFVASSVRNDRSRVDFGLSFVRNNQATSGFGYGVHFLDKYPVKKW